MTINSTTKVTSIRNAPKFRQTVLLIDDQPTVLEIHTAILKSLKMNLKIVAMTDPIEALIWLQNKQVDLIITDFRMHQMDGMQFVQALKGADNLLMHAVVVVTVLKDKTTQQELIAAGASACLTKPVQTLELAKVVINLLGQSKLDYGLDSIKRAS
ncbi:MAG: response regulator [Bdellovibrio sp.]|nr:response regulator [Methylotenera sp.]